jgi:four helix bundle protein
MSFRTFRDLDAWKVELDVAERVYAFADTLPKNERFEMAGQMRRAALSVPSNVAEGHATGARGRYQYHVRISLGSVAELLTCLELALRGGYVDGKTKYSSMMT